MIHPFAYAITALVVAAIACDERAEDSSGDDVALIEDLRLDANAEDFSTVSRLYVSPRGEIAVPLPQDAQVRVYDSTGKRVTSVGRRGQGPGEFQGIGGVGWVADSLWVIDQRTRRTTYFAPGGTVLRNVGLPGALADVTPFTPRAGFALINVITAYPDGSLLADGSRANSARRDGANDERVILRISPTGEWRALVNRPSFDDPRWGMTAAGFGRSLPFAGGPLSATATDGSRFAHLVTDTQVAEGGTYTLSVFGATGDTVLVRSYGFKGVPIPRSAADSAVAAENMGSTEGPSNLDRMFQAIAREKIPPVYAPVQWFILGLDGTIWITLRDSADTRTTLVLDELGEQIGSVVTSTRTRIRQATARRAWTTEVDADGLASVVRYRVQGIRCRPPGCRERSSSPTRGGAHSD